jgi:uncharacterized membrane protein SpoIIM required for sporulation
MANKAVMQAGSDPGYERRLRIVKAGVLTLAFFVVLSLLVAAVFGAYHYVTDRPAKELFQRSKQ